jgi:succinate-semialdehyde dehydrogenase/glutarate-semialdehyde dehydrogenase
MDLQRDTCLIGGQWIAAEETIEVVNPSTGALLGRVPRLGAAETRAAVNAAAAAQPGWAALTGKARSAILRRLFDLMIRDRDPLARLLTAEQGKPFAEALGEIDYAASFIEWFAEEARRVYGDVIPGHRPDARIMVLRQPVGVVAAITPWNFPSAMITRKIGPALAAGCTVVVKPATQTPLSALAIGVLAEEAGVPPGVLNIVTGDARTIGAELTSNPLVRKLSFTGSTEVGAALYAASASTIKKLSLELGGNAPFIVFDDADLDAAVTGAIQSKFRNAGQTCVCVNRFYVHDHVHDAFVGKLAAAVAALNVGDGMNPATHIGPLIDRRAVEKVDEHIADAVSRGAVIVQGGASFPDGNFMPPTVLSNVPADALLAREETFGPLAAVIRFTDEEDVIAYANDSAFGLASYFYTRDLSRAWRVAERIEAGIVGVNTGLVSTEVAPFGGIKASGLGREGSRHGMDDYTELKYVCLAIAP